MNQFEIGDVCIIIKDLDNVISPSIVGEECIVISKYSWHITSPRKKWLLFGLIKGYEVSIASRAAQIFCWPEELKKKNPPSPSNCKEMDKLKSFIKDCEDNCQVIILEN